MKRLMVWVVAFMFLMAGSAFAQPPKDAAPPEPTKAEKAELKADAKKAKQEKKAAKKKAKAKKETAEKKADEKKAAADKKADEKK